MTSTPFIDKATILDAIATTDYPDRMSRLAALLGAASALKGAGIVDDRAIDLLEDVVEALGLGAFDPDVLLTLFLVFDAEIV